MAESIQLGHFGGVRNNLGRSEKFGVLALEIGCFEPLDCAVEQRYFAGYLPPDFQLH